ncbi:MAG TPA: asparagine synthase (glutamine-hydrolyzing) [Longimicrobiales bacterium]|nr:asparagine synthase (glutamine-hydrolyzing) [Longimicrobiales bacterium]
MCGICGIVDFSDRPIERAVVGRMARVIAHRGPDGEGFHFDDAAAPRAALAARRLAVIDLEAGSQPLSNEDGTVWVAYNGEIYNYRELQAQLESLGHRFRTRCDTEVVVHAYEEWGDDCVERFNGMFAFAVWDQRRKRLLLARDRLGKKPLAWVQRGERLWFASEIKSLLEDPDIPRELSPDAFLGYLTFFAVPEPQGLLAAVQKVPPAHVLAFENGTAALSRYWDPGCGPPEERSEEAWLDATEELLEDAVRIRLVSDVPLGAFLSGGIDSGLLVAMMARSAADITTFNIEFAPGYSEAAGARAVAERYGTRHHEHVVDAGTAWRDLRDMVWHHDEPSQSLIQGWYVSRSAREHVTVALSGIGGDELFSGYPSHQAVARFAALAWVPRPAWQAARLLAGGMEAMGVGGARARRLARGAESALMDPVERFATRFLQATDAEERGRMLSSRTLAAADPDGPSAYLRRHFAACRSPEFLNRVLYVDQKTYLPNELLRATDSMSMAHSLEVRTPFLDYRLVELAARMPASLKLRGGMTKHVLRRLAERHLPEGAAHQPKRGFSIPLRHWITPATEAFVRDVLAPDRVRRAGFFEPAAVETLLAEHFGGKADHARWILALLTFELWRELFLAPPAEGAALEAPAAAGTVSTAAPRLSIIIVNWNTRDITRDCLASVRKWMRAVPHEVILVDNASSDGSADMVRAEFPEVRLIANAENVGFGRANNQGMRVARGDLFFLLNSDTLLVDDSVGRLADLVASEPDVGIAGCRLLNEDRTTQSSCGRSPSVGVSILEELLLYKLLPRRMQGELLLGGYWPHDRARDVDAVWGAAMMVRREVFEETGGFDERIFMYGEDLDWCMRARDRGWRIRFHPEGEIVHLDHRSSAQRYGDMRIDLSLQRGYDIYRERTGALATAALMGVKAVGALIRIGYFGLRGRRPGPNQAYYASQTAFYRRVLAFHLRALLGERLDLE